MSFLPVSLEPFSSGDIRAVLQLHSNFVDSHGTITGQSEIALSLAAPLNASTGAITGTPKASDAGKFTFSVKVVDALSDTATSGSLSITITAPTITFPKSLPGDTVGTAYSGSVAATGPVGASTYTVASGAVPADLSLNSSTGATTGTPKVSDIGTATFTIKVADAFGDTATSGSLSIAITAPTIPAPGPLHRKRCT